MMYAVTGTGRVKAAPGLKATCPLCGGDVVAKCGEIKIWHWAHKSDLICDVFKEHESEWHRNWKECFPDENREVIITKRGDMHIADVVTFSGMVIEFQNSPISFDKIVERERFYDRMVWVFNCQKGSDRIEIIGGSLQWWNPRRDFSYCRKPKYLDLGSDLFKVRSVIKDYG
jgi:competence CoiA-like predicted nuclease